MKQDGGRRAADILAERLHGAGCRHAFGMPGGEVLTLLDALDRAGIVFHLAKHENAGGFMAEGTWHVTGAPAVLLATVGPGVTNAVNVAVNAQQDRVPLIIISGAIDPADRMTYTHQVLDHRALFAPICKASFELVSESTAAMIDKAVNLALQGRPGPVHIDVPISAAAAPADVGRTVRRAPLERAAPAPGAALDAARAWLGAAERPLVIAGYDAVLDGSAETVAEFARTHRLPVLTTYKAKGIVPENDPLAIGCFALSPAADAQIRPLVEQADVIVLAGYDPIEVRSGWRDAFGPGRQKVIELTSEPNTHYVHHASVSFVGHVGAALSALGEGLTRDGGWSNGAPAMTRERLATASGQRHDWGPGAIVDEVRDAVPEETITTIDTGAHRIVASQAWKCPAPGTLLQSVGLGSMGCGLPLAIGAKIAAPERPVVALTGDAGLMMTLGELSTLSDEGLPVIVVVFADRSLALIEVKQRERGLANRGVDFAGAYDYVGLAQAFGGAGHVVDDRAGLRAAVAAGLAHNRFTLIACCFDRGAYDGIL